MSVPAAMQNRECGFLVVGRAAAFVFKNVFYSLITSRKKPEETKISGKVLEKYY